MPRKAKSVFALNHAVQSRQRFSLPFFCCSPFRTINYTQQTAKQGTRKYQKTIRWALNKYWRNIKKNYYEIKESAKKNWNFFRPFSVGIFVSSYASTQMAAQFFLISQIMQFFPFALYLCAGEIKWNRVFLFAMFALEIFKLRASSKYSRT